MSAVARFWLARGGEAVAAAMLLALLWEPVPRVSPSQAAAFSFGALVGAVLFCALRRPCVAALGPRRSAVLAAFAAFLVARAAIEEVVWRLAVTGGVAALAGWPVGLAVGTAGFALAHSLRGREAALLNAATGFAFGLLYLGTGRLICPVAAHAVYNLLVLRASVRRPG